MKHDVFISYSTEDKTIADAVCHTLEGKKIRCWIAPRDIVPGVEWSEAIVYGIRGSYVMVLVFSSHANNSPQVKREVQMAFESAIPVIPLRVENVPPVETRRRSRGRRRFVGSVGDSDQRRWNESWSAGRDLPGPSWGQLQMSNLDGWDIPYSAKVRQA